MSIFDVLTMIGSLCLFLFGMDLMGQSLERRAGGKLRTLLDRMTGRVIHRLSDRPCHHGGDPELIRPPR